MNLNDMLSNAQKGAHSPRKSERVRADSWLTIDGKDVPIHDMSDKNLLGAIKGILSTLPPKFLIEWDDTMGLLGAATGARYSKEEKLEGYRVWLGANWFKYIPEIVLTMVEEAYDRELDIRVGESRYSDETEKLIRYVIESELEKAKTDTQIQI